MVSFHYRKLNVSQFLRWLGNRLIKIIIKRIENDVNNSGHLETNWTQNAGDQKSKWKIENKMLEKCQLQTTTNPIHVFSGNKSHSTSSTREKNWEHFKCHFFVRDNNSIVHTQSTAEQSWKNQTKIHKKMKSRRDEKKKTHRDENEAKREKMFWPFFALIYAWPRRGKKNYHLFNRFHSSHELPRRLLLLLFFLRIIAVSLSVSAALHLTRTINTSIENVCYLIVLVVRRNFYFFVRCLRVRLRFVEPQAIELFTTFGQQMFRKCSSRTERRERMGEE